MTKFFKSKAKKVAPPPPVPRELKIIEGEFQKLSNRAGQVQYQKHICEKELAKLNDALESVNNEAAARQQLDKEEAAKSAQDSAKKEESK